MNINVLTKARELISTPEQWAKKHQATTADGVQVPWNSDEATCFCMMGAINRAALDLKADSSWYVMNLVEDVIDNTLPIFNDRPTTTHEDVLRAFDQAIANASA